MDSFEHKVLGQVFTEQPEIEMMVSLIGNNNKDCSVLEPSVGTGRIYDYLKSAGYANVYGIELDSKICRSEFVNLDFFDLQMDRKYDVIIGNPPYVKFKNILDSTKSKLDMDFFNEKSNLYLHFIKKCVDMLEDDGELIFLNPVEFLKSTSSEKLNKYLFERGSITHFIEYGDKAVFKSASPNVCVWRFKNGDKSRKCIHNGIEKNFSVDSGKINFQQEVEDTVEIGDIFDIKVGAVSGLDKLFTSDAGNKDFVCSYTKATGKLKRMFYNIKHSELDQHKEKLINRRIKKFSENDWWMWGRGYPENDLKRVYVNCKTRKKDPFFLNECKNFDGSVLALFPKDQSLSEQKICHVLNNIDWKSAGFVCGGRYIFSQRALAKCKVKKSLFLDLIE